MKRVSCTITTKQLLIFLTTESNWPKEELLARSQLPVAKTGCNKKEAGPSTPRPARTIAQAEEEREETADRSEESEHEEV